jgi:hypothetical protein
MVQSSSSGGSNLIFGRLTLKVGAQKPIEPSVNIFQSTQNDIPTYLIIYQTAVKASNGTPRS